MTYNQYKKQYEVWEARAEIGVCSWKFACAQISMLSIAYGKHLQFCEEQKQPAAVQAAEPSTPDEGESDLSAALARVEFETARAEKAEARVAELEFEIKLRLAEHEAANAELRRRITNQAAAHELPRLQDVVALHKLQSRVDKAVKILEPMDHAGSFVVRALEALQP
jgi:hypothetical protein